MLERHGWGDTANDITKKIGPHFGWLVVMRTLITASMLTVFLWIIYERANQAAAGDVTSRQTPYAVSLWVLYAFALPAYSNAHGVRWRHMGAALAIVLVCLLVSEYRLANLRTVGTDPLSTLLSTTFVSSFVRRFSWVVLIGVTSYLPLHLVNRGWRAIGLLSEQTEKAQSRPAATSAQSSSEQQTIARIQDLISAIAPENNSMVNIMVVQPYRDGYPDSLFCIAAEGPDRERVKQLPITYRDQPQGDRIGSYHFVLRTGEVYGTNDARSPQERLMLQIENIEEIVSEIVVPVKVQGSVVALLTINAPYAQAYWPIHEQTLRLYAHLIADIWASADLEHAKRALLRQAGARLQQKSVHEVFQELAHICSTLPRVVGVVAYGADNDGRGYMGPFTDGPMLEPVIVPPATSTPLPNDDGLLVFLGSSQPVHITSHLDAGDVDRYEPGWFGGTVAEWQPPARSRVLLRIGPTDGPPLGVVALYYAAEPAYTLLPGEHSILVDLMGLTQDALQKARSAPAAAAQAEKQYLTRQHQFLAAALALQVDPDTISAITDVPKGHINTYAHRACKRLESKGVKLIDIKKEPNYRRKQLIAYWTEFEGKTATGRLVTTSVKRNLEAHLDVQGVTGVTAVR